MQRLEFLDKIFLPIFGFKNIEDYDTIIDIKTLDKIPNLHNNISDIYHYFFKLYTVKPFNRTKTDPTFKSNAHVLLFLKKTLELSHVPFDDGLEERSNHVHLIQRNFIYTNLISKMSYIGHDAKISESIDLGKMKENITKTIEQQFDLLTHTIYMKENNVYRINLRMFELLDKNIESLKIISNGRFNNCKYSLVMCSDMIYSSTFIDNQNLLQLSIIPSLMKYSTAYIDIANNNDEIIYGTITLLIDIFQIKQSFDVKSENLTQYVKIDDNVTKMVVYEHGSVKCITMTFEKNKNCNCKVEKIMIGNLIGEITDSCDCLLKHLKSNFISGKLAKQTYYLEQHIENNNSVDKLLVNNFLIIRQSDSIYDIEICMPNNKDYYINDLSVSLYSHGKYSQLTISKKDRNIFVVDEINYMKHLFFGNIYSNTAIRIEYNIDNDYDIKDQARIELKNCYFDNDLRRFAFVNMNHCVYLDMLVLSELYTNKRDKKNIKCNDFENVDDLIMSKKDYDKFRETNC